MYHQVNNGKWSCTLTSELEHLRLQWHRKCNSFNIALGTSLSANVVLATLFLYTYILLLQDCSVIPELPNSDHMGISATMRWETFREFQPKTSRPIWRYALADFLRACDLLDATNWDPMMAMDLDQAWEFWQQMFLNIMEQCIPKGSLPQRKCVPWIST